MEKKDSGMDSFERRQLLAELFKIPPLLLGIRTLEEVLTNSSLQSIPQVQVVTRHSHVDLQKHKNFLKSVWTPYYSGAVGGLVLAKQLSNHINHLSLALSFTSSGEAERLADLLSEYHVTLSSTYRDLRQFEEAIQHAHQAVLLTYETSNEERYADALYMLGLARLVYADFSLQKRRVLLTQALADFEMAFARASHLGMHQRGDIQIKVGAVRARLAQGYHEQKKAVVVIDAVSEMAREAWREEDPLFYKLNEEHVHLEKAATLIAAGPAWANEALETLDLIKDTSGDARREAYGALLSANAYLLQKEYPAAFGAVDAALPVMISIRSDVNMARIEQVYIQLRNSPFGRNPEVHRVGVDLRRYYQRQ